jgi:arabinofuranan 3-O-arabinosyltransferase
MYYSMMLFPLVMSVVLKNSVMRNWPAWLAVYGFLSYDSWLSGRFVEAGRTAEYMKTTLGWSLLLIVIFGVLAVRYLTAKREGRLDQGIDPAFLLEPRPKTPSTEPELEPEPEPESAVAKS